MRWDDVAAVAVEAVEAVEAVAAVAAAVNSTEVAGMVADSTKAAGKKESVFASFVLSDQCGGQSPVLYDLSNSHILVYLDSKLFLADMP